jgi:hypothetical protein
MLEKVMSNRGSLRAKKHFEAVMKAMSERVSQTTDLNIIFTRLLATPARQSTAALFRGQMRSLHGNNLQPWRHDVGQSVFLLRCSDDQSLPRLPGNLCQFGAVKDLSVNHGRCVSIAIRGLDLETAKNMSQSRLCLVGADFSEGKLSFDASPYTLLTLPNDLATAQKSGIMCHRLQHRREI